MPATHKLRLCQRPRDFAPRTQIVVRLRTLWLRRRTQRPGSPFDFDFESHPLTSPANPEAKIACLHKCGCLVAHGKCIFRKCFSVLTCLWCKMIFVFILPSNTIFRKTERERERERERESVQVRSRWRAKREREREEEERAHCWRPTSFDFAGNAETSRHEPRSSFNFIPFDFAGEPRGQDRRSTSTLNHTLWLRWQTQRPGSHAFNFAPFDFADFAEMASRRHQSHWVRDWEMVGFWWIWPGLMNFFWLGFDEFDRIWWIFFCWVLMNLTGFVFIYWKIVL